MVVRAVYVDTQVRTRGGATGRGARPTRRDLRPTHFGGSQYLAVALCVGGGGAVAVAAR